MANDIFTKKFLGNMLEAEIPVPQGGMSLFHQQMPTYDPTAELIDEEKIEVSEIVAGDYTRGTYGDPENLESTTVQLGRRQSKIYPIIKTRALISAGQLNRRMIAAETPYNTDEQNRQARRYYHAMKAARYDFQKVCRKSELFCWELLQSGNITTKNGILTFERKPELTGKTASVLWSEATSRPLQDIGNTLKAIRQAGKSAMGTPVAIMGMTAFDNFKSRLKQTGDQLNIRIVDINIDAGTTSMAPGELNFMIAQGFEYQGFVITPFSSRKVHIFTYPHYYSDGSTEASSIPYIADSNAIIFYYNKMYLKTFYGANEIDETNSAWAMQQFGDLETSMMNGESMPVTIGKSYIPSEAITQSVFPGQEGEGIILRGELSPLPYLSHSGFIASLDVTSTDSPI